VEAEGRAREERTANMLFMSVTLDVSKLSGWLNTHVHCQEKKEEKKGNHRRRVDMRASRRAGGVRWSVAQAAGRPRTVEAEGRARTERT